MNRRLHVEHGVRWTDLDVDFFEALAELDAHAPALLIEASPITRAIVANAAINVRLLVVDDEPGELELPTEPVRAALVEALERDWLVYAKGLQARSRNRRATCAFASGCAPGYGRRALVVRDRSSGSMTADGGMSSFNALATTALHREHL